MKRQEMSQVKDKLKKEFQGLSKKTLSSSKSKYVAVLTADEVKVVSENKKRIEAAFSLVKDSPGKTFLFLGTKRHVFYFRKYLSRQKYNCKIEAICNEDDATTLSQIKDLSVFANKNGLSSILIVSSLYHIPRIKRYCSKYFRDEVELRFLGVGTLKKEKIKEEEGKIIKYSKKGALPLFV